MRLRFLLVLGLLLFSTSAFAQTNPCTAPAAAFTVVSDPSRSLVATLKDYGTLLGGVPLWTDAELKAVVKGANPDTAPAVTNGTITNPKSAWVLVPGTADCYQIGTVGQFLFGVPANTELDLYARVKSATATGPWSAPLPFGRAVLSAPTGLRIQ